MLSFDLTLTIFNLKLSKYDLEEFTIFSPKGLSLLLRDQRVCTGNIFALVLKEEGIK
jgi:hypothetical protein